jgi:cobalt-precorrin-5B (C1)-methyltransferase
MKSDNTTQLRKGWTTGACATAAAKAAFTALITGEFPDSIDILLPRGQRPFFALAQTELKEDYAFASVVKDAGDDPDVTHGALICVHVRLLAAGSGIVFKAGKGVGTITKAGLPLTIGEPAINPIPREMMQTAIAETAQKHGVSGDVSIEISVVNGEQIALKTMNPRLGILGGISILGTTGIVIPFSCSAWIHSIYYGIDVARAQGLTHIAGATGRTSELAIQKLYNFPESALIDMGDFVGGMLKYLRKNPVEKITIAGGFGKMCKLAQGLIDLHSRAGSVDLDFLANLAGIEEIKHANTAKHALEIASAHNFNLPEIIAAKAWQTAAKTLNNPDIELEIVIFNREGELLAKTIN